MSLYAQVSTISTSLQKKLLVRDSLDYKNIPLLINTTNNEFNINQGVDDDFNSEKIKGINIKITKLQNNVHQLKDDLELLLNPHDTIKNILQSINRTHDIENR